jgi:MOSC domain-containing protein YiiM
MVDGQIIGRVRSVNVGVPRTVRWHGRDVTSAIWKSPITGRHRVRGVNIDGDDQADRRVHGGETKSLYVYAAEDYRWWSERLGQDLEPGTFGENLTTTGIDPAAARVGERWAIGTAIVRVTEPRIPCFKLGIRMGDADFVDRFADAARPGTYLAIEQEGELGPGDDIVRLDRPADGITVGDIERTYHGRADRLAALVESPDLSVSWRAWAERRLARARAT